jgi:hypothetical protein
MKTVYITLIILHFWLASNAQKHYIKFSPSYNFSLKNEILTTSQTLTYIPGFDNIVERQTNIKSSMGKGVLLNFALGIAHNDNISTEVNFSYLDGRPTSATSTFYYYSGSDLSTQRLTGKLFSIAPTIVFSYPMNNLTPYLSVGIPVNFASFTETIDFITYDDTRNTKSVIKYSGKPVIGFASKLGCNFDISDRFSVFGEFAFTYLNFSPDKSELTKFTVNKFDSLSTLNVSQIKTEYTKENAKWYEYKDSTWVETWSPSEPRKRKKFQVPFSFGSITVGVKIKLGKNKTSH